MVKKLKRIEVEAVLKSLGLEVFTPQDFHGVFGVGKNTAAKFISSNLRSGLFVKLRNGCYLLKDSTPSLHRIANALYRPSYVSLEAALSYYGVIPEVVYTTTSVTTRIPREFRTPVGIFSYQRIKQEAFTGYALHDIGGARVLIADPEKALADYLYFVDLKRVSLNDRLRLRHINRSALVRYVKLFQRPTMLRLVERIYVDNRKPRAVH